MTNFLVSEAVITEELEDVVPSEDSFFLFINCFSALIASYIIKLRKARIHILTNKNQVKWLNRHADAGG